MSRPDPLQLWDDVAQDTLAVVRELDGEEWQLPTALPGWDVRDVVAHLAHLESEAAGMPQPDGGGADQVEATGAMPTLLTQAGVDARRDASGEELRAELEQACTTRREVLADLDTSDLSAPAPGLVGALGWDLRTWLRNRPVDLWVHATDLRRATGRTVRTDETGAANVARMLTGALLGLHLTWQATGHEQGLHEEVEYFWRTIAPVLIAPSEYEALELSRPA